MRFMRLGCVAAALAMAGTIAIDTSPASAQWRGGWRGRGWGGPGPFLGGLAAGALVGGALAARPYGYYASPAYVYDDAYDGYGGAYAYSPGYAVSGPAVSGGGDVSYCMQRYRSYDPASGTFLGYDGMRHPCP